MINNASKFALGVAVFGVLALVDRTMAARRPRRRDPASSAIALAGAIVAFGLGAPSAPTSLRSSAPTRRRQSTPIDPAEAPAGSVGPLVAGIGVAVAVVRRRTRPALGPRRWHRRRRRCRDLGLRQPAHARRPRRARRGERRQPSPRAARPAGRRVRPRHHDRLLVLAGAARGLRDRELGARVHRGGVLLAVLWMIAVARPDRPRVVAAVAGVGMLGVLVAGGAGAAVGRARVPRSTARRSRRSRSRRRTSPSTARSSGCPRTPRSRSTS